MNTIPTCVVLPFPATRVDTAALTRAKLRQQDLLELAPPAAFGSDASLLVGGENVLLPAAGHPRNRYACCAYVVSADARKALPVVGCRAWFHAPLPAHAPTHPVWEDLGGGLLEAARRLDETAFDLEGAIVATRSWLAFRHGEVSDRAGSALLVGPGSHVLCAAAPAGPPPHHAEARAAAFAPVPARVQPALRCEALRLSA